MKAILRFICVLALIVIFPYLTSPTISYAAPNKKAPVVEEMDEDMEEVDEIDEEAQPQQKVENKQKDIVAKDEEQDEEADENEDIDEGENEEDEEEEEPKEDPKALATELESLINSKKWNEIKAIADRYSAAGGENDLYNYACGMYFLNKTKNADPKKALNYLKKVKANSKSKYAKKASSAYTSCLIKAYMKTFIILIVIAGLAVGVVVKRITSNKPKTVEINLEDTKEEASLDNAEKENTEINLGFNRESLKNEEKESVDSNFDANFKSEIKIEPIPQEEVKNVEPKVSIKPVIEIKNEVEPEPEVVEQPVAEAKEENVTDENEAFDYSSDYGNVYESPAEAARRIEAELKQKQIIKPENKPEKNEVAESLPEVKVETKLEEKEETVAQQTVEPNIPPFRPTFGKVEDEGAKYYERKPLTASIAQHSSENNPSEDETVIEKKESELDNAYRRELKQQEEREKVSKLIQPIKDNTIDTSLDEVWDKLSKKALKSRVEPMIGTTILPESVSFSDDNIAEVKQTPEQAPVTFVTDDLSLDLSEESMRDDLLGKLKMLAISDGELRELMSQRNPAHIPSLIEYVMTRPEPVRLAFVARELGNYKDDAVVETLGKLLWHNDERVVLAAIQGLENTEKLSAILLLCSLVKSENPLVAQSARASLSRFGAVQLMKALETMPDNPDVKIKEAGIFVLSRMKGVAVENLLKRMLKDESEEVRCEAILAMSFQKNPVYIETLREFFRSAGDKDKSLARKAIVYLQSFRA